VARVCSGLVALLGLLLAMGAGAADGVLRVGTSGDYAPFSISIQPGYGGFDPAVARAYARDRGLEIRFVRFRWPDLLEDLAADRFDLAMSGVTVRPERSIAGRFSVPVATSGAVVLVRALPGSPPPGITTLDAPGIRIAVNAGGHLERVARSRFPRARLIAIPDNAAVLTELVEGAVDAAVTDTMESPHWRARHPQLRQLGPFTRDRKAYLLGPESSALEADLDAWLLTREADGTLTRLRAESLGPAACQEPAGGVGDRDEAACLAGDRVADPLLALLASIDERLALMPMVAEAKRRGDLPIEVPERETRVIEAALAAVRAASEHASATGEAGRPIDEAAVRALFRAQIEAAKEIQRRTLASAATGSEGAGGPDLTRELRPALIRIGDRIARLIVKLPQRQRGTDLPAATRRELSARALSPERLDEIARSLVRLCEAGGPQ